MPTRITEPFIHVAMRKCLKEQGWTLLAGDFPGGTDGELYQFAVRDPLIARDYSPDHRRHDLGEYVPDLLAEKNGVILVIEAKPGYSKADEEKLDRLFTTDIDTLKVELDSFCQRYGLLSDCVPSSLTLIPALAYWNPSGKPEHIRPRFAHVYVLDKNQVRIIYFDDRDGLGYL